MLRETAIGEEVGEGSKAGKKIQLCSLPSSTSTPLQLLSLDGLVDELDAVGEMLSVIWGSSRNRASRGDRDEVRAPRSTATTEGADQSLFAAHSFPVHQA